MSKAFTSESDDADDVLALPPLPPGFKNYITPAGAARLTAEIKQLQDKRNRLNPLDALARAQREKIEARLAYWVQRFDAAVVIDPLQQPRDRVLFGARVTIRYSDGNEEAWRIVGIDETDLARGGMSWTSPLATALLDKKVNESLVFLKRPITILKIEYS